MILGLHQFRDFPSQFGFILWINDSAQSRILVAIHLKRDFRVVVNVPHPMSLVTKLRKEIESSLVSDIPDFDSVRRLGLPAFGSKIEKLVFAVLQKRLL
jgi:hypothetical protein